jgi:hypothetical protein
MCASTFITTDATPDVDEAFSQAALDAQYESGAGGYTGTLAEKHSFVVLDRVPRWEDEALAEASRLIEAGDPRIDDKWGRPAHSATRAPTAWKRCR